MHRVDRKLLTIAAVVSFMVAPAIAQRTSPAPKPRVVITADPELDDNNTLIRALLYSSDFAIEGLIYTSSQDHWKGDGKGMTQYIPGRDYTRAPLSFGPPRYERVIVTERP